MKKKAIKVEYRKDSESFPDYLKYEITVLNEDGTTNKVPAYGRDLQDALSRVVHDERVERISSKAQSIPFWVWSLLWMSYLSIITYLFTYYSSPLWIYGGVLGAFILVFSLEYWGRERNKDRVDS
jgi:hypothetical protein